MYRCFQNPVKLFQISKVKPEVFVPTSAKPQLFGFYRENRKPQFDGKACDCGFLFYNLERSLLLFAIFGGGRAFFLQNRFA